MEFLSLSRRRSSERNVPIGEEQGETDVFAGYPQVNKIPLWKRVKHAYYATNAKTFPLRLSETTRNIITRLEFWESRVLHRNTYPNQICSRAAERLYQVPRKPRFRVKVAEHLERLIAVINDCIQTRLSFSCSFVGLAAFCTWSSILTRIVLATAIDTRDVTITWLYTMTLKVGITMILKLYETNRDTQGSALMFYRKPCLFFWIISIEIQNALVCCF